VISAIKILGEDYHFAILGIGPEESKLKESVKNLNLEKQVHFLGEINHNEMPKYLKVCNAFIRASRSEGMGNSFIEAMAAKIPVIATQEGGLSDFIFDNKTAYVVNKNNPEDIVEAVKRIREDKEKSSLIIDTAYKMVVEKYSWDHITDRMEKEVFDIIK
jgi:glycosyltransferase involved in cell wall biosynthesis